MSITTRTPARTVTATGLTRALQGIADSIAGPSVKAFDVDSAIASHAAASYDAQVARGAAIMVAEPRRITRAVYGPAAPMEWPTAKPLVEVLTDCRQFIRDETGRGRSGHYLFSQDRLVALRQAESALIKLLGGV